MNIKTDLIVDGSITSDSLYAVVGTVSSGSLVLDTAIGRHYNMDSASSATSYTIASSPVTGGTCIIRINAASEPSVSNPDASATRKLAGSADFAANTDMYLVVTWMGTNRKADYFFLEI